MRRILAVTSGRADASPMRPVIEALQRRDCQVGKRSMEGWRQDEAIGDFVEFGWQYNAVLLLGDRYETLAAALTATIDRLPIAHIHGGEASFGSFDNQIRDAITKLAHIHFVAAEPMRRRLLDLGEEPHRIHVTGAPGLDNLAEALSEPREPKPYFVVTYHPPTLGDPAGVGALLAALTRFPSYRVIWTGANGDPGSGEVVRAFHTAGHAAVSYTSEQYLFSVRQCAVVVGNSSSGIIEAPSLGVPTVNVGPRQDGRLHGPSVIVCPEDADAIEAAIHRALVYDGPFDNPYGEPGASERIAGILATAEIDLVKRWSS